MHDIKRSTFTVKLYKEELRYRNHHLIINYYLIDYFSTNFIRMKYIQAVLFSFIQNFSKIEEV